VLHLYDGNGAPPVRRIVVERSNGEGEVTWLGHAGFRVNLGGRSILIDPHLSDGYDMPLLPIGPRRLARPPRIDAIDRLDAVVISHADRDHYDMATLQRLAERFPRAELVTPAGMGAIDDRHGFATVREVAMWRTHRIGGLKLMPTPAYHYGRRNLIGLAPTPAAGWVIEGGGRRIFHSGDTGYGPIFTRIGARFVRFDLALVPIGAHAPRTLFGAVHASPEEAVVIARDLRARHAIGHHWGTFALGIDSPAEDARRFVEAGRGTLDADVLDIGETVKVGHRSAATGAVRATGRR
jgi:L-ascorbate metabolism protein UlaG (beta-lactamase superfamily)